MDEKDVQDEVWLPIVAYLANDEDGRPGFTGTRCATCAAVHVGTLAVCPRCGERSALAGTRLGTAGTLHTYTIVHRSMPDVPTPFVSAIVDLDGGGSLKANLDVPVERLAFGMRVEAVFEKLERTDRKGRRYQSFHFTAAEGERA